ncbi:MAG TPA: hypothetical protein VG028_13475, partial [Terriglobia bacterium]|nr:hypothetical protein [Terriglobia bacterium]
VELEDVAHAFEKIDEARQKAMLPGQEGQQFMGAFKELGIGSEQLHGMTASQLFMGPMRNAVQNRNPEELGALFRELGIKGFGPMITVLKTNFDELGKHMKDMGAIMSSETAVKLKAVSDEFELLSRIVISQLGPALIKLAEFIYSSVLKAGKATAGAAAFYGAGTAGQGPLHALGTMLKTAGLGAEHFVGAISTEELKKRMTGMGFNLPGAQTAAAAAQAPWKARQAEFEAMLADFKRQANDLKNPKPADFSGSSLPTKMSMKALGGPSDSLVNVGNFLGGMGITARIEERKLQLLGEIARNTREKRNPDTIARMQSSIDHYRSFIGLQTIFPHH